MAWIYKQRASEHWWIGYRIGGKQVRKSTRTTDRKEAEKQLAQARTMFEAHKLGSNVIDSVYFALTQKQGERPTLEGYLALWLKDCEGSTTRSTGEKYTQVVREFLDFTQARHTKMLLEHVTVEHVRAFLLQKQEKAKPSTVAVFRRILRSIFLQAHEDGRITLNPVKAARRKKDRLDSYASGKKRPFENAEIQMLYNNADAFWRYMIVGGYFTGLRLGDLATMKWASVHLKQDGGSIELVSRKTGKAVAIPIHPSFAREIQTLTLGRPTDYLWPEHAERYVKTGASKFSQEFYEIMATIGLVATRDAKKKSQGIGRGAVRAETGLGFHNLRHTFVTLLKRGGAAESVARDLAGHRTASISMHYTHLPVTTLVDAINTLPTFKT